MKNIFGLYKNIRIFLSKNRLLRFLYNRYTAFRILLRYYSFAGKPVKKYMIFMVDGRRNSGGLADRLYGIMNTFAICKIKEIPFKLNFTFPFDIRTFLIPNEYDWTIEKDEISYSLKHSRVIVTINENNLLKRFKLKKQTHIYTNTKIIDSINKYYNTNFTYMSLFNELFKPVSSLQIKMEDIINNHLSSNYIGIHFRCQNLFGDFPDILAKELSEPDKQELLMLCVYAINTVNQNNEKIFLASDSLYFLEHMKQKLDNIYFIHGDTTDMCHIDLPVEVYAKPFLDLFILGCAHKVFNIYGHGPYGCGLYKSGFSAFAAEMSGTQFEAIDIDTI
jgi:hypothetical protein